MTIPTPVPHDDDGEALYWLQVARRLLSGELAPHDARAALLNTGEAARGRSEQPSSAQY